MRGRTAGFLSFDGKGRNNSRLAVQLDRPAPWGSHQGQTHIPTRVISSFPSNSNDVPRDKLIKLVDLIRPFC
jgi:hypothetical protein